VPEVLFVWVHNAGRSQKDWDLDDPAGRPLTEVRRIRDQIGVRVDRLLEELLGTGPS
jgi:protein-tyrosine-phosphatase